MAHLPVVVLYLKVSILYFAVVIFYILYMVGFDTKLFTTVSKSLFSNFGIDSRMFSSFNIPISYNCLLAVIQICIVVGKQVSYYIITTCTV